MNKEDLYTIIVKPKSSCDACELDLKKLWTKRNFKAIEQLTGHDMTNRCIKCFKPLKSPKSIRMCMGPTCRKKFKADYWKLRQIDMFKEEENDQ